MHLKRLLHTIVLTGLGLTVFVAESDERHVDFVSQGRILEFLPNRSLRLDDQRLYRAVSQTELVGVDRFELLRQNQLVRIDARYSGGHNIALRIELLGQPGDGGQPNQIDGRITGLVPPNLQVDFEVWIRTDAHTRYEGDADRFNDLRNDQGVIVHVVTDLDGHLLAREIRARSPEPPPISGHDFEPFEVLALLAEGADPQAIARDHHATLLSVLELGAARFSWHERIDDSLLIRLEADPRVTAVEPNYRFRDPESVRRQFPIVDAQLTGDSITSQDAFAVAGISESVSEKAGEGVIVAILDTGISPGHEFFVGRLDNRGWDFVDDDPHAWETSDGDDQDEDGDIDESFGHGTFVASLVAAVAPKATLLPIRVLDDDGGGRAYDVALGLAQAIELGADIIVTSFAYERPSRVVDLLLEQAELNQVLVIAAAGNDGSVDLPWPAADSHSLAVTGLEANGQSLADFSNRSAEVELAAPAEEVLGALPGQLYGSWSGTSMSAPLAAGAAAVLLSEEPGLDPELLSLALIAGGRSIAAGDWSGVALDLESSLGLGDDTTTCCSGPTATEVVDLTWLP